MGQASATNRNRLAGVMLAGVAFAAAVLPADAQFLDPIEEPFLDERGPIDTQSFIDEYGQRVTVDAYGRVLSVERPSAAEPPRRRAAIEDDSIDDDERRGFEPLDPIEQEPGRLFDPSYPDDPEGYGTREPIARPNDMTVPEARPAPKLVGPKGANAKAQIAAFQILLDRAGISPGVIDGRMGGNVDKAVAAYMEKFGEQLDPANAQALAEELDATGGPAIVSYTISDKDAAGPYIAAIPDDYGEKAKLPAMSYSRVSEMLAERFHMDEAYLIEINPGADFDRPGTILKIASTGADMVGEVVKIVADKGREQVRAYDAVGRLVVAYPSTIGSANTPSPSGVVAVARIAFDPGYTYNPKINFTQGENRSILQIPPGPNGPVGSIWIALSKPTYGIHGTPEPSKIGKTNSYGCVRLTNFDAAELAKMVKPGVTVEFLE